MTPTNRLAAEPSPYLRQHAANPVDWYPWGPEALALARETRKPILLSIGYSACHWCHVMAHESFEDAATAAVMNRLYVNVKVDREERPDLDHLYQATHRLLNPRTGGGWPLTVFLTPEGVPFFSGTYFPATPRHGLPAFTDLLERAADVWRAQPDEIARLAEQLREALDNETPSSPGDLPTNATPIATAAATLAAYIDPVDGGFGGGGKGPKFPQPQRLAFGLAHAREPVLLTLRKMAEGGIYDHVGGGFCRYSVDAQWTIPHFEKMLYDNGALLALYADAYCLTREPRFAAVVEQTIAWAVREMRDPSGGFYAALDADSEGEEGRFYVWSRDEVARLLPPADYAVAAKVYGLDGPPNFEGAWHLRVAQSLDDAAASLGIAPDEAARRLDRARAALLDARAARVRPGLDDKILVSWNALMVRGLARAARVFDRADWLDLAQSTLDFLRERLWRDGVLHATWQAGAPRLRGYLDDAAFLLDAVLELMQARWRPVDLDFALALGRLLLDQFEDTQGGGFFFTSHAHEPLLHRGKPVEDNATPGGNGVAAFALQRLAWVTGEPVFAQAAERTLATFAPYLHRAPHAVPSLLAAYEEYRVPPRMIVLRGPAEALAAWKRALAAAFDPHRIVLGVSNEMEGLPAVLAHPSSETVAAYLCVGSACLAPVFTLEDLNALLSDSSLRSE